MVQTCHSAAAPGDWQVSVTAGRDVPARIRHGGSGNWAVANDRKVIQKPPFNPVGIAPIISAQRCADIPDVTP